jgi:hypothetical protein
MADEQTVEDVMRRSREERFNRDTTRYCPDRIFRLARTDPIVTAVLASWRHGDVTWEQSLIAMVEMLVDQNERVTKALRVALDNSTAPIVVKIDARNETTPPIRQS